jgi:prevent-host-death family protein
MKTTVNVHEAKTHLSRLLKRVASGEEIVIARGGTPVAALVPLGAARQDRKPGSARGQIAIREDFDAPLPDELLRGFTG